VAVFFNGQLIEKRLNGIFYRKKKKQKRNQQQQQFTNRNSFQTWYFAEKALSNTFIL